MREMFTVLAIIVGGVLLFGACLYGLAFGFGALLGVVLDAAGLK